jgi:hypothetical protein
MLSWIFCCSSRNKSYKFNENLVYIVNQDEQFLIETKNWSEASINNFNLYSPVEQIKRNSYAIFKLLTDNTRHFDLSLNKHPWGNKKIPIKNLVVLTNSKPIEAFQYVKILTLDEMLGYIKYFKPIFMKNETEEVAKLLLRLTKNYSLQ